MNRNRRGDSRYALVRGERLPVRLEADCQGFLSGTLADISLRGTCLDVALGPWVPEPGMTLRMFVDFPGLEPWDFFLCLVAHRHRLPEGFRLGLRFLTAICAGRETRQRAAVAEFIEQVRRERIESEVEGLLTPFPDPYPDFDSRLPGESLSSCAG
jgi:hypothetical protein